MVVIVLASRFDDFAAALVARWAACGALLTPADLSTAGWRATYGGAFAAGDDLGELRAGRAMIGGRPIASDEIAGVYTRIPSVFAQELAQIVPEDREYVAAEMTAFLTWWLAELPCPVVNRPTPVSLAGPGWSQERWIAAAARAGLPVETLRCHLALACDETDDRQAALAQVGVARALDEPRLTLVVVGDRCFGADDEEMNPRDPLAVAARQLAAIAGVALLSVTFVGEVDVPGGWRVASADPWPEILSDSVAEAVCDLLTVGVPAEMRDG